MYKKYRRSLECDNETALMILFRFWSAINYCKSSLGMNVVHINGDVTLKVMLCLVNGFIKL